MVVDLSAFSEGIVIPITGDISGLKTSIDGAEAELGGLSNSVKKNSASIKKAGIVATAAGGAIVGAFVLSTKASMDFETSMSEVYTLLPGMSADAMAEMSQDVRDFSSEVGVTTDKVVPALYQAISAGVPKDNVFDFLTVANMAAIGGVTDLETAVDGITSVINAYGTDVISAAEASDLMFTAVKLGKTTFEELSASLFQVIPMASSLGVEFGDVTAALSTMTAQGTPTSVATTQLRQALVELSKDGGKASDAFKEIAGVGFKEFIAQGNNLQDALNVMATAAESNGVAINDMFGSVEAGSAVLSLTGAGAEKFTSDLAEMSSATGATEAAFETVDDTAGRSIEKLQAMFEEIKLEIGDVFLPILKDDILPAIKTLLGMFNGIPDGMKPIILAVGALGAALVVIGPLLMALPGLIGAISVALTIMSANPVVLIIAGIVLAIIGLIALLKWLNDEFHWVDAVMAVVGAAFEWLQGIIQGVVDWFSSATEGVDVLGTALKVLMGPIGWVMIAMEMFGISWEDVWQGILDFAGFIWESLTAGITAIIGMWVDKFNYFKDILFAIWTAISGIFIDAWTNLTAGVTTMINFIVSIITSFRTVVLGIWTAIWTAISSVFVNAWTNLKIGVTTAIGFITGIFTSFRDTILGIWNTIWNGIKFVINSITGGINVMIRGLNNLRIDIPEWVPFMGGQTFGISIPEIPQLAKGGIVTEPTIALIGEAGPEAVIPLESLSVQTMGINLAGIPKLATGGIVTEPTIAMIGEAGPEAVVPLDGSSNLGGISINIENLSVRNDQDVKLIAQELATMIDRKNRGRGVTY
jgi:TP901 family phage tail tape measure protein